MSELAQKNSSLSRNSLFVLLSSILKHGFSLFSGIVAARILFPQDFGIIGMAATFSGLIDVFSRFGFEAFIISRQNITREEINSVYLSNIFIGIVSAIIVIIGAPFVAHLYKTPDVKYILFISAFLFIVNSCSSIPRAILLKEMNQGFVAKIDVLQGFLNTSLIIMLALSGFRYLSYVIALLVSNLVICIVYLLKIKWKFSKDFSIGILKESFDYGKSFLPKTVLSYFVYYSDYIFVGCMLGPTLLGYYCFGFDKALILVSLICALHCNVFFPLFSKIQTQPQELEETFFSLVEKQALVLYPLVFLQIILAKEIINIIYSSKWDNSILTFQLILGYTFWRTTASIIHVLFDAVGKPEQNLKHFLITTPVCVAAFLIGTKLGGLFGVSIAAFLVHTFTTFLLFIRTCNVFCWSFKKLISTLFKYFIPIVLQLPIIIPLKIYLLSLHMHNIFVLLIITFTCLVLYLILVRLFYKEIYFSFIKDNSKKILIKLKPMLIKG